MQKLIKTTEMVTISLVASVLFTGATLAQAQPAHGEEIITSEHLALAREELEQPEVIVAPEPVVEAPVSEPAAAAPPVAVPAPVPVSGLGSAALNVAYGFAGVPYVANAASPAGFDCSGLVSYAFAQVGLPLPHNANAIGSMGTVINPADAQPGDLVVYSGHIEFWVSPGVMFGAAVPGTVVGTHNIWGNPTIVRL